MRASTDGLIAVAIATIVALHLFIAPKLSFGEPIEDATFFIEEVHFEGLRLVSERIVLAESLLQAGTRYSETELQHAMRRIRRLPAVLTVDFRLDRGTERGRYRLTVAVGEARRFFFGVHLASGYIEHPEDEIRIPDVPGVGDELCIGRECFEEDIQFVVAGIRQPIASAGVLWAALQLRSPVLGPAFELGYTQYDLWGSRAFASARAAISKDDDARYWWYTLEAGIPVHGNHSLRLLVDGHGERTSHYFSDSVFPEGSWTENTRDRFDLGLEWRFDSRDDPLFPTVGRLLAASLHYQDVEREYQRIWDSSASEPQESESTFARLSGTWFRPLSRKSSVSWGAALRVGASDIRDIYYPVGATDFSATTASIRSHIGYLTTLWRPVASPNLSDLRWETTLSGRYGVGRLDTEALPDFDWYEVGLETSLTLRNRWGVFAFSLVYRTSDGSLQ